MLGVGVRMGEMRGGRGVVGRDGGGRELGGKEGRGKGNTY